MRKAQLKSCAFFITQGISAHVRQAGCPILARAVCVQEPALSEVEGVGFHERPLLRVVEGDMGEPRDNRAFGSLPYQTAPLREQQNRNS